MDEPAPRKRPRPVISCLRCREKKLKCDRSAPCEQCLKAQVAEACVYSRNEHVLQQKDSTPVSAVNGSDGVIEDLQIRLAKVEELLGLQRESMVLRENGANQVLGTVVVKGSRTVYHGQNDRTTLLNQFLDVKDFLNNMGKDGQINASIKQVKFLQSKTRAKIASPDSMVEPGFSLALLKLREFLPPRAYCRKLVSIYCRHFERTMRVLHIPTFTRQCDQIWSENDPELCNSSSILPQITVAMTMAHHMDDSFPLNEDQTHKNYLKGAAIDMVQAWLDELPRKQRTELATLQVEVLLLLSRSMRHSRPLTPEKLWSSTGALVRSAVAIGLNMDPAALPGMSPFYCEMRRRLWATILEIDLQASITCGMPLICPDLDPASATPSNLNDLDFDESTSPLPAARPLTTCTDNVYQVILASTLTDRLKAASLVQRAAPNLQQAVTTGRKIQEAISLVPTAISISSETQPTDAGSLLHCVFLDLYLRRPLLCLYKPLLMTPSVRQSPLYTEIQSYCLSSSRTILSYQDLYTIDTLASIADAPWANQNFFHRACKIDIIWAALTLCQHVKDSISSAADTNTNSSESNIALVQSTITHLITRIVQKGSDLKDIVFLALACESVQWLHQADKARAMQDVVKATLAKCRERLLQPLLHHSPNHTHAHAHAHSHNHNHSHHNSNTASTNGNENRLIDNHHHPNKRPRLASNTDLQTHDLTSSFPSTHLPASSDVFDIESFPMDLSTTTTDAVEQWFTELPDLAAEFTALQGEVGSTASDDVLNFGVGVGQEWNWEHMWQ